MKPVTFFDIISAMRDRRVMKFTGPSSVLQGRIDGILLLSRNFPHRWSIIVEGSQIAWSESNEPPMVISETA